MRPFPVSSPLRGPTALCLAVLVLCLAAGCKANVKRDTSFVSDAEPDAPRSVQPGRKWQEEDFPLPAWPREQDLVEVKLDGPDQALTHYIDKRSLATGDDGVVRYTLVTTSASGARNLSFEGLRCTPKGRWKTYAFGMDGRFKPTTVGEAWREIRGQADDPLHYDLWQHYLCIPRAFEPRPRQDQVRMLQSGRVPGIENAGFMAD
jgi:hypothetical protein